MLKDLRKSSGSTEVIHGVSMHIDDGEFVAFGVHPVVENRPCCA